MKNSISLTSKQQPLELKTEGSEEVTKPCTSSNGHLKLALKGSQTGIPLAPTSKSIHNLLIKTVWPYIDRIPLYNIF